MEAQGVCFLLYYELYKQKTWVLGLKSVWKDVNLREPKEGALGKGFLSFGEGFMGWKHEENT